MPTLIAVRCPRCQNDHVAKRGKTARGIQRYLCQHPVCATGSFLLDGVTNPTPYQCLIEWWEFRLNGQLEKDR